MSESVAYSIICPILIGRESQRTTLLQLLPRADSQRGQTLLLAGEAGIGKSRLVAEVMDFASEQAIRVIAGCAFETDTAIPCALLAELLRAYLTTDAAAQIVQELGPSAAEVAKLLPELSSLLPFSTMLASPPSEPDKRRLFEALLRAFVLAPTPTAVVPTLIIVEDAHWCDHTSLDFLLFLARKVVAHPILLLITYRDNEVSAPLARLLAELTRERLAVEMTLQRLTKPQTEAMLRAILTLPRPVQDEFLDALYSLTEGNPFFIEEVLKSCVATGDIFQAGGEWGRKVLSDLHIPRTIQMAVNQRVQQLTPSAQQLLKVAAVIGHRFDFSLLQQVSQQPEMATLTLLKELIAAQFVVEESADRFAFRHALTRQAVYFSLLARERRALHSAVSEAMSDVIEQQQRGTTRLSELAYHLHRAEKWQQSWPVARRAGENARLLYAPRAAVEHFTYALEAAHHLSGQRSALVDEYDTLPLYRARGEAYETLGDFEAARADFEETLVLARARQDRQAEWQSLLDLGFLWTSRDFEQARIHFQHSLVVARSLDQPILLAQSLNRMGNWYVNNEQPQVGQQYHAEALTIFQALDDHSGLAATLDLLAGANFLSGNPAQSIPYYEQATALFRQLGEQRGLTSCLTWLTLRGPVAINLTTPAAPLPQCMVAAQDALQIAREIQWRPGEAFAMIAYGQALGAQGDYAEGLPMVENVIALAQEIDHRWDTVGYIALATIYLDLGMPTEARAGLERGQSILIGHNMLFSLRMTTALLAATDLLQGQSAKARATLATAFGDPSAPFPSAHEPSPTLAQRLYWFVRAALELHEKRAANALSIVEHLLATTGTRERAPEKLVPRLMKLRGDILCALQRADEAERIYLDALDAATVQGARPVVWRIHQALGQLYKTQGDRSGATRHFDLARSQINVLATNLPTAQMRQQFLDYALGQQPAPASLTPLRARKQDVDGLTARECEIAALIQQGYSDREIADRLSLSKRTVSTHVSNILTKLNFTSRAQIAAWAVAKGL